MSFSSVPFIFLFLPITLLGFFYFGRSKPLWGATWLTMASIVYYGLWSYQFLPVIAASVLGNYLLYRAMLSAGTGSRKPWLILAICFNIGLLAYFKYVNFFIGSINQITGTHLELLEVLLPIGISFFTFTQIAFLVDSYRDGGVPVSLGKYVMFATYFPYIVAGPVLHHKVMLPQFADPVNYRFNINNLAVGGTLFAFGMAKKLLLADNLTPVIDACLTEPHPAFWHAWLGIFAYGLQLYFDFSGYSDMAIGVSRMLGFQIPFNFDSPYKAASVSEFWTRWHISLSRFLRNYLYIALGGNRAGQFKRYRNLMLTMLLGGLWHGSNWTFVIWGGLHGLYLCIQHGWQSFRGKRQQPAGPALVLFNRALTFIAVMVAWCFFRANDLSSALDVLGGMAGLHGVASLEVLSPWQWVLVGCGALVAFAMPNTNQIFLYFDNRNEPPLAAYSLFNIQWRPSVPWGLVTGLVFALGVLSADSTKEFIYVQF